MRRLFPLAAFLALTSCGTVTSDAGLSVRVAQTPAEMPSGCASLGRVSGRSMAGPTFGEGAQRDSLLRNLTAERGGNFLLIERLGADGKGIAYYCGPGVRVVPGLEPGTELLDQKGVPMARVLSVIGEQVVIESWSSPPVVNRIGIGAAMAATAKATAALEPLRPGVDLYDTDGKIVGSIALIDGDDVVIRLVNGVRAKATREQAMRLLKKKPATAP